MTSTMSGLNIRDLRELLGDVEPAASVYLAAAPSQAGDTSEQLLLRRRAIARQLADQGADQHTIDVVDAGLGRTPGYLGELGLIAASGYVRAFHRLPGGVPNDRARFGAPAMLGPLLAWHRHHPAHLVAFTDRTGADISIVPAGAHEARTRTVAGPDDEIERNAPGGWSQPRFQRRAEDSWLHNAGAVAEAIEQELAGIQARLVLLAGDVRACQLLSDRLSRIGVPPVIRQIPGGRRPDNSDAHRQAAVEAAVRAYAKEQEQAVLDRYAAARGPHGTAVSGGDATLAALASGRVATLLVVDDPADERAGWFDASGWCTTDPEDERAGWFDADESHTGTVPRPPGARRGRLVDVAIRSALLGQADVCVLEPADDPGLPDGLAAVCRYR